MFTLTFYLLNAIDAAVVATGDLCLYQVSGKHGGGVEWGTGLQGLISSYYTDQAGQHKNVLFHKG